MILETRLFNGNHIWNEDTQTKEYQKNIKQLAQVTHVNTVTTLNFFPISNLNRNLSPSNKFSLLRF